MKGTTEIPEAAAFGGESVSDDLASHAKMAASTAMAATTPTPRPMSRPGTVPQGKVSSSAPQLVGRDKDADDCADACGQERPDEPKER